jgi:hypothetical protein
MNTDEGNEAGFEFAVESNSELSKGDGFMAQKNRKLILMNKEQIH